MNSRTTKRAFTLIELLVVIAIIGILAAITVPAVTRALRRSRRARCASNLKQIGYAVQMYLADNGQQFPEVTSDMWESPSFGFGGISEDYYYPLLNGEVEVFRCPAQRGNLVEELGTQFSFHRNPDAWTSYEYNNGMSAYEDSSGNLRRKTTLNKHVEDRAITAYIWDYKYDTPYNPHVGGLNVLYLDWHVSWLPSTEYKYEGVDFYNRGLRPL